VRIPDHVPRIVARAEDTLNESVQIERFWSTDFNGAVQRSGHSDRGDQPNDIVGRNRLDEHRRHAHGGAVRRDVGNLPQTLEE
jgi:hypothetical protein